MNQSEAEDRIVELEIVLRDLLDNFEVGPEGTTLETADEGIVVVTMDLEESIERATDVLEREE